MRFSIGDGIGIVSATLVLFGGLLPWWSVTVPPQIEGFIPQTFVALGFQEGGVMTIVLSLMSLAIIAVSRRLVLKRVGVGSIGAMIFLIALVYYLGVTTMSAESSRLEPGLGLVISLIGGAGLVASIVLMRARVEEPPPTQNFSSESPA